MSAAVPAIRLVPSPVLALIGTLPAGTLFRTLVTRRVGEVVDGPMDGRGAIRGLERVTVWFGERAENVEVRAALVVEVL